MPTIIPIAFNDSGTPIPGTTQIGDLSIGETNQDYGAYPSGYRFWATPDLDLSYVIAFPDPTGNQPNPLSIPCYVGFYGTQNKTDLEFLDLANYIANQDGDPQNFTNGADAITWLNNNGYWTSYINTITPTPTPTQTNTPTPTNTPTVTPTNSGDLKVLFLGDTLASTIAGHISNYISATGYSINYSAVTMGTTYTGSGGITPANYDVVVIYTNASQTGSATLSTALTNYVNAGGSVVSGVFLWNLYASGYNHSGTTAFNATNSQSNIASPAAFTVSTPSVITNGIGTSFGELVLTNANPTLSSGASLYASYNSGSVRLLAVKEVGSSKLVSINTSFTNINTSGETLTKLVGNAILFAGGKLIEPTPTPTSTNTPTPTQTPTNTNTPTNTSSSTPTPTVTPTSNIVTSGLIIQLDAYNSSSYPGTGTTVYDITGGYNHTLIGATYTVLNGIKCFDCTTGNNRVNYSETGPTLPNSGYTYITWARLIPSTAVFRTLLYTKGSNKITPITIPNASNTLGYWATGFVSSGYDISSSASVWVQLAIVGTNTTQKYYLNGSQVGSTINSGAGGNTHWGWGNNDVVAQPWGHVANMFFYNRQLSLDEITQQYNFLAPRFVEPSPTPTSTPTNTNTPTPTQTPTNTNTPTNTSSTTPTPSVTTTQTNTPSTTPTNTPTPSSTETFLLLFEDGSIATAENNDNIEID